MSGRPPHDLTGEAPAHGPPDRFGELLRSLRRQAHLTQRELADRAGLSTAAIRDLEQGRTRSPRPDSIDAIAAVLALSSHDTGVLHGAAKTRRSPATTPATGALRINILGSLDVRYGDVPLHLNSDAQRALLVRLALAAGTTVSQDELVDLLWPRGVPANAGNLLQTRIARLRRLLAADELSIVGSRAGYRLEASTETLDLLAFRDLVAKAAGAAPRTGAAPEAAADGRAAAEATVDNRAATDTALDGLAAALALWRGEPDTEAFHPLYQAIANEHTEAVHAFAALAREVGVPERALKTLRDLTSRRELDEPLHAELIQTLAAAGRQAEALSAYERIRTALADQLGIDPGEQLRAVQLAVLRQQSGAEQSAIVQQAIVQQVPSAPPDFVGRAEELATISTALRRPGAVSSRAVLVNGIAGVGKTALALTAAHHLRKDYPDGQLYADLRGAEAPVPKRGGRAGSALPVPEPGDRGGSALPEPEPGSRGGSAVPLPEPGSRGGSAVPLPEPGSRGESAPSVPERGGRSGSAVPLQVLGRFLRALGVPSRRIGTSEAEAAALFRSELAGRRILVLLDNAQDAAQIRPLLPGAGRSDVIVTSRRRLPELDAAEVVDLEPLPHDDAARLIISTARTLDARAEDVSALAEACARLPLALRIAGGRLATRREWTVADLARRLEDDNRRLSELSLGESSVLNSFQLSYADLTPGAQRAFRLCSLHPGDDFSADSSGILLGLPTAEAERVLEELLEANMLLQHTKYRYRFHDLLGLYAGRLLADDPEASAARSHLYSWYAEAVTAAIDRVYPQVVRLDTHGNPDSFFASETAALTWLSDELRALVAVVTDSASGVLETASVVTDSAPGARETASGVTDSASGARETAAGVTDSASGDRRVTWQIADQLRGYFLMRRDADGWLQVAQAGTTAAKEAGDHRAYVAMLINRAQALSAAGLDDDSLADGLAGHVLAVAVGWAAAAGYTAHQIGWHHLERGNLREAAHWMSRALEWAEPAGHLRAVVLNGLGMTRLYQGELRDAAELFADALRGNAIGRPEAALIIRGNLGGALRQLGEVDRAADLLCDVLDAYRQQSYPRGELSTLDELARLHLQRDDAPAALDLALRAHDLAITGRDRKAQAQTTATVAQVYLALDDLEAAIKYGEDCRTIAHGTYPYLEAEALLTLAEAHHRTAATTAAVKLATHARTIATTCGFGLLEHEATTLLHHLESPSEVRERFGIAPG
ncbi:BTAD domain-containing putative transcriptional regulator [Kribbella endophytica]